MFADKATLLLSIFVVATAATTATSSSVSVPDSDSDSSSSNSKGHPSFPRRRNMAAKKNRPTQPLSSLSSLCIIDLFEGNWTYQGECLNTMHVGIGCDNGTNKLCSFTETIVEYADDRKALEYCPAGGNFRPQSHVHYEESNGRCVLDYIEFDKDPCEMYQQMGATVSIDVNNPSSLHIRFSANGGKTSYNKANPRIATPASTTPGGRRELQQHEQIGSSLMTITNDGPMTFKHHHRMLCDDSDRPVINTFASGSKVQVLQGMPAVDIGWCVDECLLCGNCILEGECFNDCFNCVNCILDATYPTLIKAALEPLDPIKLKPGYNQTERVRIWGSDSTVLFDVSFVPITGLSNLRFDWLRKTYALPTSDNNVTLPIPATRSSELSNQYIGYGSSPTPGTFGGTWTDTMRLGSLSAETHAELERAFSYCFNLDGTNPSFGTKKHYNDASLKLSLTIDGEFYIYPNLSGYVKLNQVKLEKVVLDTGNGWPRSIYLTGWDEFIDFNEVCDGPQKFGSKVNLVIPKLMYGINSYIAMSLPQMIEF